MLARWLAVMAKKIVPWRKEEMLDGDGNSHGGSLAAFAQSLKQGNCGAGMQRALAIGAAGVFVGRVETAPPLPFSAVLLAGGKSSRMGRDKAGLIIDGQPLWQRQLETLRAVGPRELFISGRFDGPYAQAGVEIVQDATPGLGPIAGIAAALHRATSPLLLVLAIDLPEIGAEFLTRMVEQARRSNAGVVPWIDRHFEALAAVYPRAALPLIVECLGGNDRSMQRFMRCACEAGLLTALPIAADHLSTFRNLNRPEDLQ